MTTENLRKLLAAVAVIATRKGLKIRRNVFQPGWSIQLPNGAIHDSTNTQDLVNYVKSY